MAVWVVLVGVGVHGRLSLKCVVILLVLHCRIMRTIRARVPIVCSTARLLPPSSGVQEGNARPGGDSPAFALLLSRHSSRRWRFAGLLPSLFTGAGCFRDGAAPLAGYSYFSMNSIPGLSFSTNALAKSCGKDAPSTCPFLFLKMHCHLCWQMPRQWL